MSHPFDRLHAALAGRYTVTSELGRGGMATVYLAEDLRHRRKVAVKVLRPDLAATLGPERFAREIEIAAPQRCLLGDADQRRKGATASSAPGPGHWRPGVLGDLGDEWEADLLRADRAGERCVRGGGEPLVVVPRRILMQIPVSDPGSDTESPP